MMTSLNGNITRENCGKCSKQIYLGQSAIVCSKCNIIFHASCITSDAVVFRQNTFCNICIDAYDIIRYNPYFTSQEIDHDRFYEFEITDYTDMFDSLSQLLENCQQYSTSRLNSLLRNINNLAHGEVLDSFSTLFYNIDGNNSNFDKFACEIAGIEHKFSIIGLAETNISSSSKGLYSISEYSSCYQDNKEGKKKGSGVGLYINKNLVTQSFQIYLFVLTV